MRGVGDVRSGTVPVRGLQYTTSPSLPSAVKLTRDIMMRTSSTLQCVAGETGSSAMGSATTPAAPARAIPFPQGTLQLYDSYYKSCRDTEPTVPETSGGGSRAEWTDSLTLPDDLSGIGPSARHLLRLDAAQQHPRTNKNGPKKASRAPVALPVASRILPAQTCRSRAAATTPATGAAAALSATAHLPLPSRKCMGDTDNGAHASTATLRQVSLTANVRPTMLLCNITNPVHGGGGCGTSTVSAAAAPPPLVTRLQSYIKRELVLNSGGTAIPSAMDQLNPYREAFRALGSAFPAYGSLFDDIQCAYDNVIQAQAELLTDAYSAVAARHVEKMTQQENAAALHQQVSALQVELSKMETALKSRALAEEQERQQATMQCSRTCRTNDTLELQRELKAANQRVSELERASQIDLEKILVLIGAVRECDRRLKEYERLVTSVMGQVSELDEFKCIAGEAQAELQQFRKKYSEYVPASDFCLMREYLTSELQAAQLMTRRWRRTAAVRGTQLDVMQCRLTALEEDREALVKAAAAAAAHPADVEAHDSDTDTVLTPRPSWKRLYERYPELSGYAADVGRLTTELDRDAADIDPFADEERSAVRRTSTSSTLAQDMPAVKGPKETGLQVEYLVQRIVALEGLLRTQWQQQQQQQLQRTSTTGLVERGDASTDAARANCEKSLQEASLATKDEPTDSSAPLQHRNSRRPHGLGDAPHNAVSGAIVGAPVPRMAPPLELPLLGLGYAPWVPLCWRASGVLCRRSVAPSTIMALIYHFFLDVLPTYLDKEDKAQQALEQDDATAQSSTDRLAPFLYELLQSEMQTREDLHAYDSVAHLMMNLERDGQMQEWHSDALHLFLWIAHGVMPPRLGVDAVVVVAQVKRDVRALAKELQSSRLRRQALGECLQPVLELKTVAELAELRAALGGETTFSAEALCSDTHPFMQVLLVQECRAGMELYVSFLRALTARACFMTVGGDRAAPAPSAEAALKGARDPKAQPAPQLSEGDRVLSLSDVSAAVLEVEPCTPEVVLRELSVNAVIGAVPVPGASEEPPVVVRLSDMVRAIGTAPLIRRTVRSAKNDCVL
ncbi:conserved hypothetical protein [Leishmania infantum JPCM5]|uniref:Uncharacterized protein n=2 Tax=Leishmania infantum TaxID=5671 RepID=A4I686_LEIIN|nr:conserved hypothetical protein [Leishmania infantum JPCM5]CAC9514870.1 hypothetical_protein_-_conserved [Leishmania infantum]CAM70308.2 conserved hypothetical protein [Leishmania infantum JPCM5]SUZ44073.1 hypothetical_protein_-_conserved [Leishmania infantum]|eukprot:XP_001467255.2 conserved hypothetical protein [Leishmania infantum JPCM5]